ncbi:ATP-dependent nuclease [Pedobacter nototheniae]|uniref:ATP-dependent nuclease n=1 Tax=Pedobacter nototheniae TaxID=2488994 RepID=UPI00292D720C|nr:AAA family ATPase [Pedobacter nototheniae]
MYISKLVIKNYRTFKDFTINLKPLTLIVGENNIGKSNLLDSIGLIFSQDVSYHKRRFLEVADFNYDVILELKKAVLNNSVHASQIEFPKIIIQATLTDWDADQGAVVADWYEANLTDATLTYVFEPNARFKSEEEILEQRTFLDNYKKENGDTFFNALPEQAKLDLVNFPISKYYYYIYGGPSDASQANPFFLNQLKFELLDALRDACTELVASHHSKLLFRVLNSKPENEYQDLKGQLVGLQSAIKNNTALQDIRQGIADQLDKISLATDDVSNEVDLLFSMPDVADILKKISLIYGENPIKIERNGTGRNNLLYISLVLSYIEDITRANCVYFRVVGLEEPESHLHPNLQDHLAHNIEDMILMPDPAAPNKKINRKDIQLLITSHSTHITTKIDFENTLVLYRDGKSIRSHYILSGFGSSALASKRIRYLNKYLDAVNANLFYSRKIILVEGISEKLLVPTFFRLLTGHSTEKSSCCVISVNGLAFSYFLEIIKNGFFQKCTVFTDRDSDTQKEDRAENLETAYNLIPQIHISISGTSTFEKDLIASNASGAGRELLLNALKIVRPTSGKAFINKLGNAVIPVDDYFALIQHFKSEFAYTLMLMLDEDPAGFVIPDYISEGIKFLD